MLRKCLCALVVLGSTWSVAAAEMVRGKLVSVDAEANKLKFQAIDKETKKPGEVKEYAVSDKVKVIMGIPGKGKDTPVEGGLKAEALKKIGQKGARGSIEVEDGTVTALYIQPHKKEGGAGNIIRGKLLSVDAEANKLKFQAVDKETKKAGEVKEYTVSDKVKVYQMVPGKGKREAEEGGLKADVLKKLDPRGGRGGIIVEADVVTTIVILPPHKKRDEKQE